MTRFQLAKLVQWAGTLRSRERLQKVVSMLQAAGCPLEAEYRLHHFGPYSDEVAHLTDEMVQVELLEEEEQSNAMIGNTYNYRLSEKAEKSLAQFETSPEGKRQAAALKAYEPKARRLLDADLKELEYAATIVFFRQRKLGWSKAIENARVFKKLAKNSSALHHAESLAREIVA
jgi:uncharacterized protein YwgA